jgi:hypothetical protein
LKKLERNLTRLIGCSVRVVDSGLYPDEAGEASVNLLFSDGTQLRADYWRLFRDGRACLSGFDHRQQYGLPAPIDAIAELEKQLENEKVSAAKLDLESGDLVIRFGEGSKLQVFNFTGYEIWELRFPDGTVEYSNYALR